MTVSYTHLQLIDTTPTAANVKEYIEILKDKTLLRRIAEVAGDLTAAIQQGKMCIRDRQITWHWWIIWPDRRGSPWTGPSSMPRP